MSANLSPEPLLGDNEPAAVEIAACAAPAYPLLLVCDHASNRVPECLANLGVGKDVLDQHVGWDIGAAEVTRRLAEKLNVPSVYANYSRLVVDCNRPLSHSHAFPEHSDGIYIPANENIGEAEKLRRIEGIFNPYHSAVAEQLARFEGAAPAVVAIHSFTPFMDGYDRPWHCGILWDKDGRLAEPMIETLRSLQAYVIGDNEPYSGRHPEDFTLDHHAEANGLPHVAIELRQDLIEHDQGAEQWAGILAATLKPLLADDSLYTRFSGECT